MSLRERIDQAASETDCEPTPEQREAGNYRKGRVNVHGLPISIENARGSYRQGNGWRVKMPHHYGYIRLTESEADGDHIDVFLGPCPESELVFVVDQETAAGRFDEHKVLLGFTNAADAREGYAAAYSSGWRVGPISALTLDQFKAWLRHGKSGERIAKQLTERYGRQSMLWEESEHPRDDDGKFKDKVDRGAHTDRGKQLTEKANRLEEQADAIANDIAPFADDPNFWSQPSLQGHSRQSSMDKHRKGIGSKAMREIELRREAASHRKAAETATDDPDAREKETDIARRKFDAAGISVGDVVPTKHFGKVKIVKINRTTILGKGEYGAPVKIDKSLVDVESFSSQPEEPDEPEPLSLGVETPISAPFGLDRESEKAHRPAEFHNERTRPRSLLEDRENDLRGQTYFFSRHGETYEQFIQRHTREAVGAFWAAFEAI